MEEEKGDALSILEADLNDLQNTTDDGFSALHNRLSAIEHNINQRFSTVETMLLDLIRTQTSSPPPPNMTQKEHHDHISSETHETLKEKAVENNNSSSANGKRKANGNDAESATDNAAVKPTNEAKSAGVNEHRKNAGTEGSKSSSAQVSYVTGELIKAISLLKTPEDLVEFESILKSIKMPINVKTPTGQTLILKVERTETVDSVKEKVYDQTRLIPFNFKLVFGTRILDDHKIIGSYNIQEDSILHLAINQMFRPYIEVITLRGENIIVAAEQSEIPVKYIKTKLHEKEGIPPCIQKLILHGTELEDDIVLCHGDHVHLTLRLPNAGSTEVEPEKRERKKAAKVVTAGPLIMEIINDIKMLKNPPVSDKIKIYVITVTGRTYALEVGCSDTIQSVKVKFYEKTNIPLENQMWFFDRNQLKKEMWLLDENQLKDDRTLKYYNIQNKSIVHMVLREVQHVQDYIYVITLRGEKIALPVERSDKYSDVKAKIYEKEGIPVQVQKLDYSGKEVADDQHLSDCCCFVDEDTHEKTVNLSLRLDLETN